MKRLTVNMVSESDITVQGHGVHTAYDEMASALEARSDVELIRGGFGEKIDADIIHLHTIGPRVWSKLRQKGPKKVISAHVVPASLVGSIILAKHWLPLARKYMSLMYKKADVVLAVSKMVADSLEHELGVPAERIKIFYNTVDMSRYHVTPQARKEAREKLGIRPDEFVVLGNGQVQPRKRLDVFVDMAKKAPDIRFIWIGGVPFKHLGAEYAAMQRLIESVPDNLTMTGIIPHDDVFAYLAAADVFCLPAEQENHPMCVLEAAGAGLPIILRDIPEYDDTFQDDVIRKRDGEFLDAVRELQNPAEYKKWQARTKIVADRFDSHTAAERLVKLYRDLL